MKSAQVVYTIQSTYICSILVVIKHLANMVSLLLKDGLPGDYTGLIFFGDSIKYSK